MAGKRCEVSDDARQDLALQSAWYFRERARSSPSVIWMHFVEQWTCSGDSLALVCRDDFATRG